MPLTHVLHVSVSGDVAISYPTINDDLIMTTKDSGHQFHINNQHVFILPYKQLIFDGYPYAKAHARARARCEAYLSVQCQATGTVANTLKKELSYNQI